jgi:hypothetical protein
MLQKRPLLSVPMATKELGLSKPIVAKAINHLTALGWSSRRGQIPSPNREADICGAGLRGSLEKACQPSTISLKGMPA